MGRKVDAPNLSLQNVVYSRYSKCSYGDNFFMFYVGRSLHTTQWSPHHSAS